MAKQPLNETDRQLLDGLKFVKNAHIENRNGKYVIVHYNTDIFTYNPKTETATVFLNCSQTSNRQIKYAKEFFCVTDKQIKKEYAPEKWMYSRGLNQ